MVQKKLKINFMEREEGEREVEEKKINSKMLKAGKLGKGYKGNSLYYSCNVSVSFKLL